MTYRDSNYINGQPQVTPIKKIAMIKPAHVPHRVEVRGVG